MTTLEKIIINADLGESQLATTFKDTLLRALKGLKKAVRKNRYTDMCFGKVNALVVILYSIDFEMARTIDMLALQIYLGRSYRISIYGK